MKTRTLEEQLYRLGWILAAVFGILAGGMLFADTAGLSLPCPFLVFFGLYCPGCGGTRAVSELFHGHFLHALWYHPLVLYAAALTVLFLGSHTLEKLHVPHVRGMKYRDGYLWGALAIVILNWIVKNVLLRGFGIAM